MIDLHDIAGSITHAGLRDYTEAVIGRLDPEFWDAKSSSTGKYHPVHEIGPGGLVKHTIMCTACALEAMRRYQPVKRPLPTESAVVSALRNINWAVMRDVLLCGGLLHDGWKCGIPWGAYTKAEHPSIGKERMLALADELQVDPETNALIDQAAYAVEWHYGIWTKNDPVAPLDFTDCLGGGETLAVAALCLQEGDYYASRRWLAEPDWDKVAEGIRARP